MKRKSILRIRRLKSGENPSTTPKSVEIRDVLRLLHLLEEREAPAQVVSAFIKQPFSKSLFELSCRATAYAAQFATRDRVVALHRLERLRGWLRGEHSPEAKFFAVLGLSATASRREVRRRYLELSRESHPDRLAAQSGKPSQATSAMNGESRQKALNTAYERLSGLDDARRAELEARALEHKRLTDRLRVAENQFGDGTQSSTPPPIDP